MKKIITLFAIVLSCTACKFNFTGDGIRVGNGKTVRCGGAVEVRDLELADFTSITVNGKADLDFVQAESARVTVKANQEVFDYLDFHVEGSTLVLDTRDHVNIVSEAFDIQVAAPMMERLVVNGAVDLDVDGGYRSGEDLTLVVNGAGDLSLRGIAVPSLKTEVNGAADISLSSIDVEELSISINGAGDVDVSGKAGKALFSIAGAGAVDARNLDAGEVKQSKSGLARIRL